MIKPATLWAFIKTTEDTATVGRVCRAVGGQAIEELSPAENAIVAMINADNEWMNERAETKRTMTAERTKRWREKHAAECDASDASQVSQASRDASDACDALARARTSVHPSIHPSVHPNTNRSVTVTREAPAENGNGTADLKTERTADAKQLARQFADAVARNQSAFFDPGYDTVTAILAVTGDYRSAGRWRQLVHAKGDAAVREETYAFWREICAGEGVKNRGASLNARLGRLPDATND